MAIILRQSTGIDVRIGPFVDVGDGFTPETGITLSGADEAELLKANGAATVSISGATWAAVTGCDGWYDLTLTSSHTDTVGELIVVVQDDSVCLPVFQRFYVVEEAVYDDLYAASADPFTVMQSDVAAIHSQTTVIESDSIIIESSIQVIEPKASDTHSRLVVVEAAIDSDQTSRTAQLSDIDSLLAVVNTKASDTHSRLVVVESAIDSDQTSRTAAISDVKSQLTIVASDAVVIETGAVWARYSGPRGPGIYVNDAAANTNTTFGSDGTVNNPVSTIGAAKTLADGQSIDRIYLVNDSAITLAATMTDYEFVGIGTAEGNSIALASQDVSNSSFYNLTISGVQGGAGRARYEDCQFGVATLHLIAYRCGFTDSATTGVTFSNNDDNVLVGCFSMVAGNAAPVFTCSAANLDLSVRHYSGGVEIAALNASATVSIETDGQVIFKSDCNTGAAVTMRGNLTITDNTGGMSNLTTGAVYDKRAVISDTHSRLVVIEASIDSDQTSRTAAISDVHSRVVVVESSIDSDQTSRTAAISDVHSRIVVVESSIDSDQTSRTAQLSDIDSLLSVVNAKASDTHSRLVVVETAVDSDQTSRTAQLSDIDSLLAVVNAKASDTHSRLVVVEAAIDSDQTSRTAALSDIKSDLVELQAGYVESTTKAGTLSTTQASTNLTETTNDHYIGCLLVFVDGNLAGQRTDVTDYVGTNGVLTFTALTEAPAAGDTFRLY